MDLPILLSLLQETPTAAPEPWFDPNLFGALYGGLGGGLGGTLAGLCGAAAGHWAPRGEHRGLVLGAFRVLVVLGGLSLALGLGALLAGQPYGIWFAPVLVGLVLAVVPCALLPRVRRAYDQAEQRRLEAGALRRG